MSLGLYERDALKSFLVRLYGPSANGWYMDERVFNVTFKMLSESKACSKLMDWVPRPPNPFSNPLMQLGKQGVQAFLRALSRDEDYYVSCLNQVKASWKAEILRTVNGV